jgi:hypothetical protein
MRSKRVRYLLVAATAMISLVQGAALADQPPRLGQNVQATKEDVDPFRTYSAPYMAVDPANDMHVVASYIDFRTSRCGLLRSTDGGQSWKRLEPLPVPPSMQFCLATQSGNGMFHSPVAFGRDHMLYYALIGWDAPDDGGKANTNILLARSSDLGDSWETTVVRDNRGKSGREVENARPVTGIAVDAKSGSADVVYVSWARRLPNVPPPNAEPIRSTAAVSTDGGRTFGEPFSLVADAFASPAVRAEALGAPGTPLPSGPPSGSPAPGSRAAQLDQEANFGAFKAAIVVDDKGTLYSAWPSAVANFAALPPPAYFLTKSTDQGETWTVAQITPFILNNRAGGAGPGSSVRLAWSPKGGKEGTLHLVAEGTDTPEVANVSHVFYFRSTDGGVTWSQPKTINDRDPTSYASQYMPNVSVSPDGRVDVAWWDTRHDTGTRVNDVYYTSSTDNGDTFTPNVRITDRSIDRRYGVFLPGFTMSAPPGIASTDAYAIVGWDDTRLTDRDFADSATVGGGLQDVFTATIQHKAFGGGTSKAVNMALAGAVGLLLVGLVVFVASLPSLQRPATGPPAAETIDDRHTAGTH